MKSLNVRALALTVFSLLLMATFAPQLWARGGNLEQRLEKMTERLELTDDQVGQVRGILENAKSQMQSLRDQDGDRASKRAAVKSIREEADSLISSILTAEQRSKYEAAKAERKEKRGDKRGGKRGGQQN